MGETIWKKFILTKGSRISALPQEKRKTILVLNEPRRGGSKKTGEKSSAAPGKVGVTARDVGHVGRVILGKGNHVPQGRERRQDTGHLPRWSFPAVDSALRPC